MEAPKPAGGVRFGNEQKVIRQDGMCGENGSSAAAYFCCNRNLLLVTAGEIDCALDWSTSVSQIQSSIHRTPHLTSLYSNCFKVAKISVYSVTVYMRQLGFVRFALK